MPLLTYTVPDFVPFTKIISADVNSRFTQIKAMFNWAGTTSATTGLNDANIQSITASGGGLTRSTKLKAGTANYVIINDANGAMSEEAQLASSRGGTGINISPASYNAGDVIQINSTKTALEVAAPTAVPAPLRVYTYSNFK